MVIYRHGDKLTEAVRMTNTYDINTLTQAVNDYFYSEEEIKLFLKTWVHGWWEDKTAKEREEYTKYHERNNEKYNTVNMLCQLVNIDMKELIAMVKAFNRYEKKNNYEKCVHVSYVENVQRLLAKKDSWEFHYKSTGRRMFAE
jgi:hypothetical protein